MSFSFIEGNADHWVWWCLLAEDACEIAKTRGISIDLNELPALLAAKQHDYGHENIERFGIQGVVVRLWDKIARLHNLTARGATPENESLRDTFVDIIGYCVIGMMLSVGWFKLPLAADVSQTTEGA